MKQVTPHVQRLAWLLSATALMACTQAPVVPGHEPALPASFAAADDSPGARHPGSLPWQHAITDARTQALVEQALTHNRDLRVAMLSVEQARAALGLQQADQLPTVGLGANVQRSGSSSSYSAGLALSSFELDLFGRVRALSAAAAERLLASEEAQRTVRLSLITTVADTELALRADDALLALTTQVLASREATLQLVRAKVQAGMSAEPELQAQAALVATAQVNLAMLHRQRLQRENALAVLVGGSLPTGLPAPRGLLEHRFPELAPGLPSQTLLSRPDVRQAEAQLRAAQAQIDAARAAFFPRISLTGSAGSASTELSGLFERGAWSFTGNLLQPLFDAGRNQANLRGAELGRDVAIAQYEKTIQVAFREVADALVARQTLRAQLIAQRDQAHAEAQRLALVQRLSQGGMTSALERLDAERSHLTAQQALIQLELALRQNQLGLYRVLGGGG